MLRARLTTAITCLAVLALSVSQTTAGVRNGLKEGTPDIKSAGALAFGPNGVLFIGDSQGAAIFAIDTGDAKGSVEELNIKDLGGKIAGMLGVRISDILINDMAVNPASGNTYLSVSRGRGPEATPVLLRISAGGRIDDVPLKNISFAKADLPNAPSVDAVDRRKRSLRQQSITDLAYVDGQVFIAGLSNEEFSSNLRSIPFPFTEADKGSSVKIFHGAHGKFETNSPVRTFAAYDIGGNPHLLAAYTCTPLVKFSVADLKPGSQVTGTTIAELGNRNQPLDMVVYKQGGKDYVLLANSSRGMMKITTENIDGIEGITQKIGDKAGLTYETIKELQGVVQLDRLNEKNALVLIMTEDGKQELQTVVLP